MKSSYNRTVKIWCNSQANVKRQTIFIISSDLDQFFDEFRNIAVFIDDLYDDLDLS